MYMKTITIVVFWLAVLLVPTSARAKPSLQSNSEYVRVCYDNSFPYCETINGLNSQLVQFNSYIPQVLANEWHPDANLNALKAGAISIRTFVFRDLGCGAYLYSFNETPPIVSRVVSNLSQRYRITNEIGGTQNPVTSLHVQARDDTSSVYLYRTDGGFACAKHNTYSGNPTKACAPSGEGCDALDQQTLPETVDPVDSNNPLNPAIPTPRARSYTAMSQNGSHAWTTGIVPWDYRQILTHYYTKVKIGVTNTQYRWVWLNVGNTISFESNITGDQYYSPIPAVPTEMRAGTSYQVRITLQNTGTEQWTYGSTPATSYRLVYEWCDTAGANCVDQTTVDIGLNIAPGGILTIYPTITAPSQTGTKRLKIDMMTSSGIRFSTHQSQNWPTQQVNVEIRSASGNTFLPWAASSASGPPPSH